MVENCLTNDDEINTIQNLQDQIRQLNEKITKISEANNRSIEENIMSNKDISQERADQIAEEALY